MHKFLASPLRTFDILNINIYKYVYMNKDKEDICIIQQVTVHGCMLEIWIIRHSFNFFLYKELFPLI